MNKTAILDSISYSGIEGGPLLQGRIHLSTATEFSVETSYGHIKAKRAASCLMQPCIQDIVLLAKTDQGDWYILAILVSHQGKVEIAVADGKLKLSAKEVELESDNFSLSANTSQMQFGYVACVGETLNSRWQQIKSFSQTMEQIVETMSVQAARLFNWVSELEHQTLGRLRMVIKNQYRVDCQRMDIYAEEDAKIDAKQIHLG